MVIYDLICENQHEFEGWFKNSEDLTEQQSSKLLSCPICDSLSVSKRLTAPKVTRKSNSRSTSPALGGDQAKDLKINKAPNSAEMPTDPKAYKQLQKALSKVHEYVESNYTDVGNKFASEAIKIHRGEKDPKNIRGIASQSDLKVMAEEGVSAIPLPPKPVDKKKLN